MDLAGNDQPYNNDAMRNALEAAGIEPAAFREEVSTRAATAREAGRNLSTALQPDPSLLDEPTGAVNQPADIPAPMDAFLTTTREDLICQHTLAVLQAHAGDLAKSAGAIGITIKTLKKNIKQYRTDGIEVVVAEKAICPKLAGRRLRGSSASWDRLKPRVTELYKAETIVRDMLALEEFSDITDGALRQKIATWGLAKEFPDAAKAIKKKAVAAAWEARRAGAEPKTPRDRKSANPRLSKWTENDGDLLIKLETLYANNYPTRDIAAIEDFAPCTPGSINQKLTELGLPKKYAGKRKRVTIAKAPKEKKGRAARKLKPGDAMPPRPQAAPVVARSVERPAPVPVSPAVRIQTPAFKPRPAGQPAYQPAKTKAELTAENDRAIAEFLAKKGVTSTSEYQEIRQQDHAHFLNTEIARLDGRVTTHLTIRDTPVVAKKPLSDGGKPAPEPTLLQKFEMQLKTQGFARVINGLVTDRERPAPKQKDKQPTNTHYLDCWWHEDGLLATIEHGSAAKAQPKLVLYGQLINAHRTRPVIASEKSSKVFEAVLPGFGDAPYLVRAISMDCTYLESSMANFNRMLQRHEGNWLVRGKMMIPPVLSGRTIVFSGTSLGKELEPLRVHCQTGVKLKILHNLAG